MQQSQQKGFIPLWLIIVVIVAAVSAGGAVFISKNRLRQTPSSQTTSTSPIPAVSPFGLPVGSLMPTVSSSQVGILNWKVYRSEKYGFEFSYPPNLVAADGANDDVVINESTRTENFLEIRISVQKPENFKNLQPAWNYSWGNDDLESKIIGQKMQVDQRPALKYSGISKRLSHTSPWYITRILVDGGTATYLISSDGSEDYLNQIFPTIKFTNQVSIAEGSVIFSKACRSNSDCSTRFTCYKSDDVNGRREGDWLCHKRCVVDQDCGGRYTCQTLVIANGGAGRDDRFCLTSATTTVPLSAWELYSNKDYGFEVKYPPYVGVGFKAKISEIGSGGVYVGPLIIVPLLTDELKKSADDLFNRLRPSKNASDESGPGVSCNFEQIPNQEAIVDYVSCGGEGGLAQYAIVRGSTNSFFVDGYTGGSLELNGQLGTFVNYDADIKTLLSTFKILKQSPVISQCGNYFSNEYKPVTKNISEAIQNGASTVQAVIEQGYHLQEACNSSDKVLLFFDFSDGYWRSAGKVSENELSSMSSQAIMVVANPMLDDAKFYNLAISGYRLEGPGGMACHPDKIVANKILFICADASDSGASTTWYVYDMDQKNTIKAKSQFTGFEDSSLSNEKVFRSDLISLFTTQTAPPN